MRSRVIAALQTATAGKIAVRDDRGSLTYEALREAAHAEARWLRASGVRRSAVLADDGANWIIADLALLRPRPAAARSRTMHRPGTPWTLSASCAPCTGIAMR